jgi:hypothetical protein
MVEDDEDDGGDIIDKGDGDDDNDDNEDDDGEDGDNDDEDDGDDDGDDDDTSAKKCREPCRRHAAPICIGTRNAAARVITTIKMLYVILNCKYKVSF